MAPPNGVPASTETSYTPVPQTDNQQLQQLQQPQQPSCENCKQNQLDGGPPNNNVGDKTSPSNNNINEKADPPNNNVNEVKREGQRNGEAGSKTEEEDDDDDYEELIVPPDGGWGWVVAFASFMCNMVVDGIIFSFGMFLPHIVESYGASKARVALAGSLLSGTYLLVGPFVSALANRFGFRTVAIAGSFLGCFAFIISYFATSVEYLYVTYGIIGGIGFGLIYVPSVIAVGFYFEKWRALATGIAVCGSGIGTFVMAPICSTLIEIMGWKKALLVQAGMVFCCMFFGLLFRPVQPTKVPRKQIEEEIEEHEQELHEHDGSHHPSLLEQNPAKTQSMLSIHKTLGVSQHYPTVIEQFTKSSHSLNKSTHSLNKRHSVHPITEENTEPLLENQTQAVIVPARRSSFRMVRQRTNSECEGGMRSRKGTFSGDNSRPLYRDDIFFGGSLARIPQYTSHTNLGYTMSVTRIPTENDIEEGKTRTCKLCPESVRRTLATMLDISLLQSPSFLLLATSGGFTMMGFFVPFMYLTDRATTTGMAESYAMWLVSAIGVCNTIGRVVCGLMSSHPKVNTLWVNNIALSLGGLVTIASGLSMSVEYQFLYSCVFGLSISCFASLRSILLVDLVGLEKLTNAFGISLVFQGVAAAIGAPMAGAFMDATGSYDASFYLSGSFILISGLMCYPLKAIKTWETNRQKNIPV